MTASLSAAFLLSGAAALLFETLWFRLAGLAAFRESAAVRRLWPAPLRDESERWFGTQRMLERSFGDDRRPEALSDVWQVLDQTPLRRLPLLLLNSEPRLRDIARVREREWQSHPALAYQLGLAALADHDYARAERLLAAATGEGETYPPELLRVLALALGGRRPEAVAALSAFPPERLPEHARPWRAWLASHLAGQ